MENSRTYPVLHHLKELFIDNEWIKCTNPLHVFTTESIKISIKECITNLTLMEKSHNNSISEDSVDYATLFNSGVYAGKIHANLIYIRRFMNFLVEDKIIEYDKEFMSDLDKIITDAEKLIDVIDRCDRKRL